ncbi:GNAT family N-acetyltransferase [bacterium]|nr:GNAT family N-acetyltransferase [bacterium]
MLVNYTNTPSNNLQFTSLNNPIKPFQIITPKGTLDCIEVNYRHLPKSIGFYRKLSEFFIGIFSRTSSDPNWKILSSPKLEKDIYDKCIEFDVKKLRNAIKDKNTTVLYVRDKAKNLVGAIVTKSLKETPFVKDNMVLYVDSLAVVPEYRGFNIAKTLLYKVFEASQNSFTDAFLAAYKESVPFYEKLGFSKLSGRTKAQQYVISEMAEERYDYPKFVRFLSMPLSNIEPVNWCDRIYRRNIPKY